MHSPELVRQLHEELQNIVTNYQVLLGGSYVYQESTHESDVDFFVVVPLWRIFSWRQAVAAWKKKYPTVEINIMLVPQWCFKRGLYYVYGQTLTGELVRGPLNHQAGVMSALKLGYYNYLRYRTAKTEAERSDALKKIAQKIAITLTLRQRTKQLVPSLATSNIKRRLKEYPSHQWASDVLAAKTNNKPLPQVDTAVIERSLDQLFNETTEFHRWFWVNYFIYNAKFLPKGRGLFLFGNPDTILLAQMRSAIQNQTNLAALRQSLTSIIFPVIML